MNDPNDQTRRKRVLNSLNSTINGPSADTTDDTYSPERRSFIKRVGVTLGAIPIGAASFSGTATADNSFSSSDEISIRTSDVSRPKRNQIVHEARHTDEFDDVAAVLNVSRNASSVVEYHVEIEDDVHEGHRVTFGEQPNGNAAIGAGSSFVNVYLSETFDSGAKAIGKEETDGGIRSASSDENGIYDLGTQRAATVAEQVIPDNSSVSTAALDERTLKTDEAVLGYSERNNEAGGVLIVPIEQGGEVVDRAVLQLHNPLSEPTIEASAFPDDVSTMGHVVCDPTGFICTNYCKVLCVTLGGVAAAGCFSKCTASVVGIPISPGCAAICGSVVAGTCNMTCKDLAH